MTAPMMSFPVVGGGVGAASRKLLSQKLNIESTTATFDVNLCSFFCSRFYDRFTVRASGSAVVTTSGGVLIAYTTDNGANVTTSDSSSFGSTATWNFVTEAEIPSHVVVAGVRKMVTGVLVRVTTAGAIAILEGKIEIIGTKY